MSEVFGAITTGISNGGSTIFLGMLPLFGEPLRVKILLSILAWCIILD